MSQVYNTKTLVSEIEKFRNCVIVITDVDCKPCETLMRNLEYLPFIDGIPIIYAYKKKVSEFYEANNILSVPSTLFYKNGGVTFTMNKSCTRSTFERMIRSHIYG